MKRIKCDVKKKCCEQGNFTRMSEQKKLFYFETPKCASSSMKKMLIDALPDYKHGNISNINEDYLTFTVVRNPFDRFVSNYHMITTTPHRIQNILKPLWKKQKLTFEEFVNDFDKKTNHHWLPMDDFLPDDKLGFIFRFEHLKEDIAKFKEKTGIDLKHIHMNKCRKPKPNYKEFFTKPEWIEKVKNYYIKDLERFEYIY
jgi:hypothetical protein